MEMVLHFQHLKALFEAVEILDIMNMCIGGVWIV